MGCSQFNFQLSTCTQVDIGYDDVKVFTVTDDNGAVDLTGFGLVMIIKDNLGGSDILVLDIVGDDATTGLYIPDPATGIVNMLITEAVSALIAAGWYVYQTVLTDPSGKDFIFMQGSIQFYTRGFNG